MSDLLKNMVGLEEEKGTSLDASAFIAGAALGTTEKPAPKALKVAALAPEPASAPAAPAPVAKAEAPAVEEKPKKEPNVGTVYLIPESMKFELEAFADHIQHKRPGKGRPSTLVRQILGEALERLRVEYPTVRA